MHASDSRWPLDLIGRSDFKGQENAGVGREFKFKFPSKNIVNMQLGGPTESHTSNQSKVLYKKRNKMPSSFSEVKSVDGPPYKARLKGGPELRELVPRGLKDSGSEHHAT